MIENIYFHIQHNFRKYLIIFLFSFGLLLRTYHLGTPSLWLDEMFSVFIAKSSDLNSIFWDANPFLYYLLLKIWHPLTGDQEFSLRFLSVLFSCLTGIVLYFFSKKETEQTTSLILLFLWCFFPISIQYAQEVRMYSLFELLSAINLITFYGQYQKSKLSWQWVLTLFLLASTHYFSFVLILFQILILFFKNRGSEKKPPLLPIALSLFLFISFYLAFTEPIISFLDWQKIRYSIHSPLQDLWLFLNEIFFGHFTIFIVLILVFLRVRNQLGLLKKFLDLILVFIISAILFGMITTFLLSQTLIISRYFIFLTPYILFLSAILLKTLLTQSAPQRIAAFSILALLLLANSYQLSKVYQNTKAPWREVAQYISHIPNSVVLNTRSQSIQSPYFENRNIEVEKWIPDQLGIVHLETLLQEKHLNVFIIENFWGGFTYWEELKSYLLQQHYIINENNFSIGESEPLILIQIRKP